MNEDAERWLVFAREDLHSAEVLLREGIYNQVCFHAQQCVEKGLKCLIAQRGNVPPRIHSIAELLALHPADWFADLRPGLIVMDDFYIPTRYPDALPGALPGGLPGRRHAEEAFAQARLLVDRVVQLAGGAA